MKIIPDPIRLLYREDILLKKQKIWQPDVSVVISSKLIVLERKGFKYESKYKKYNQISSDSYRHCTYGRDHVET